MACNWGAAQAICQADVAVGQARARSRRTRSGKVAAHSKARMPPMEPPTTAAQESIPKASASASSARTVSRMVMRGNRLPQAFPSCAGLEGPVVPWQPPSTLGATTKYLSVSRASPGPTSPSHQPGLGCPGPSGPVMWESPVRACSTRTPLVPCASGSPQVW